MTRAGARRALVSLCAAAVLCGCGGETRGHATPEAAEEFAEVCDQLQPGAMADAEDEQLASLHRLVDHFAVTADARYRLPDAEGGYSMLHLACFFKKPELARCLLLDGADPNARALDKLPDGRNTAGDTPLSFALTEYGDEPDDPAAVARLIEVLVQGGADLSQPGPGGTPLLLLACRQSHESVLLKLLDAGLPLRPMLPCESGEIPCTAAAAANGWSRALERLLDALPQGDGADRRPLQVLAEAAAGASPGAVDCMRLLISRGADVNAPGVDGDSPLRAAAKLYYSLRHGAGPLSEGVEERSSRLADAIVLLLREGADPLLAGGSDSSEFPGFTAADFIAGSPGLMARLRAEHIDFIPPEQHFSSGVPLLAEICRYSLYPDFKLRDEDVAVVAQALSPTPDMAQSELCEMALPKALAMLAKHDAARCSAIVQSLPLWSHPSQASPGAELCHHLYSLLIRSLIETPNITLPSAFITQQARQALAEDEGELSAMLLELLARCPDAEEAASPLLRDEALPLQAGAWRALLLQRGLPTGRDQGLSDWLHRRSDHLGSDAGDDSGTSSPVDLSSEPARKVRRLTSLQELWYGRLPKADIEQLLRDIDDIGAPRAEQFYRELTQNLDQPDKLDELSSRMSDAAFELEIATSRYILQHADTFQPRPAVAAPAAPATPAATAVAADTPAQP